VEEKSKRIGKLLVKTTDHHRDDGKGMGKTLTVPSLGILVILFPFRALFRTWGMGKKANLTYAVLGTVLYALSLALVAGSVKVGAVLGQCNRLWPGTGAGLVVEEVRGQALK
jgi:hypothetical protein